MKNREDRKGRIYAVLFDNGHLKVGRAHGKADYRVRAHMKKAAIVGATKSHQIIVEIPYALHKCERELISYCTERFCGAPIFGVEWFREVGAPCMDELEAVMYRIADQSAGLAHTCPTEAMANNPFNRILSVGLQSAPQIDIKYIEALGIAKGIQAMISNDLVSGDVFTAKESLRGLSYFTVTMSILLYEMPDDERGECMREIVECLAHSDLQSLLCLLSTAGTKVQKLLSECDSEGNPLPVDV